MTAQASQDITADTDDPRGFNHKFAVVNGIRLHYVEERHGRAKNTGFGGD